MSPRSGRFAWIVVILLLAALAGVRLGWNEPLTFLDLWLPICMCTVFALLFLADVRVTRMWAHHPALLGHPLLWSAFLFWPVVIPCYLVWSRGWRGVFVAFVCGLVLMECFAAPYIAADYVLNGSWGFLSFESLPSESF